MTSNVELPTILRDIAAGRRNTVGDFWSRDYCNQAAAEIERLLAEREVICAEAVKYADKSGRLEAKVDRLADELRKITELRERHHDNLHDAVTIAEEALRDSESASA